MRYKYTLKELDLLLKSLVVVIDSREQKNEHIIQYFKDNKIQYKFITVEDAKRFKVPSSKLDFGDYSCYIERNVTNEHLITSDIWFDRDVVIERKNSIDELLGNIGEEQGRRIKSELAHIQANNIKCYLFLEDNLYFKHMDQGKFRANYKDKDLPYKRFKAMEQAYNFSIIPVPVEYIGKEIYWTLYYYVRALFKERGFIQNG